jgi:hypothetical protein
MPIVNHAQKVAALSVVHRRLFHPTPAGTLGKSITDDGIRAAASCPELDRPIKRDAARGGTNPLPLP